MKEEFEDAISRKDVVNYLCAHCPDDGECFDDCDDIKNIKALPYIKPQESKEGCWIEVIDEIDSLGNKTWHYECSICRSGNSGWGNYKYCPDCGTKMKVVSKQK